MWLQKVALNWCSVVCWETGKVSPEMIIIKLQILKQLFPSFLLLTSPWGGNLAHWAVLPSNLLFPFPVEKAFQVSHIMNTLNLQQERQNILKYLSVRYTCVKDLNTCNRQRNVHVIASYPWEKASTIPWKIGNWTCEIEFWTLNTLTVSSGKLQRQNVRRKWKTRE